MKRLNLKEHGEILRQAERILINASKYRKFVPTYSRNVRQVALQANAFYFEHPDAPPRAVLFGYCVYFHAPGLKFPALLEEIDEAERKRIHLGALHARLRLETERDLGALQRVLKRL